MDIHKTLKVTKNDKEVAKALEQYRKNRSIKSDANAAMTEAQAIIKAVLNQNAAGKLANGNGVVQAYYRESKPSLKVNTDLLKTHPDLLKSLVDAGIATYESSLSLIVKD